MGMYYTKQDGSAWGYDDDGVWKLLWNKGQHPYHFGVTEFFTHQELERAIQFFLEDYAIEVHLGRGYWEVIDTTCDHQYEWEDDGTFYQLALGVFEALVQRSDQK